MITKKMATMYENKFRRQWLH